MRTLGVLKCCGVYARESERARERERERERESNREREKEIFGEFLSAAVCVCG